MLTWLFIKSHTACLFFCLWLSLTILSTNWEVTKMHFLSFDCSPDFTLLFVYWCGYLCYNAIVMLTCCFTIEATVILWGIRARWNHDTVGQYAMSQKNMKANISPMGLLLLLLLTLSIMNYIVLELGVSVCFSSPGRNQSRNQTNLDTGFWWIAHLCLFLFLFISVLLGGFMFPN